MKARKLLFLCCFFISIILFADGVTALAIINKREQKNVENKKLVKIIDGGYSAREDELVPASNEAVNVLVLGLDEEEVRSDVIILLNYSPSQSKINLLSIGRDTRVINKRRYTKINSLIGTGGEKLIIEKVEQLTNLPIHYYITVNFKGFREFIDELGGVEMYVPINMNYDDPDQNLHIHLKKGYQLLDGKNAEQFVRYRKGNRGGEGYSDGDLGRIKMQQEFVVELIKQKAKLRYLSKAYDIFFIMKNYMRTNIEIGDINYYIKSLKNVSLNDIQSYTLPGDSKYINNIWYFLYDKDKIRDIIANNFFR